MGLQDSLWEGSSRVAQGPGLWAVAQLYFLASAQFPSLVSAMPGHFELPTSIPESLQVESCLLLDK